MSKMESKDTNVEGHALPGATCKCFRIFRKIDIFHSKVVGVYIGSVPTVLDSDFRHVSAVSHISILQ